MKSVVEGTLICNIVLIPPSTNYLSLRKYLTTPIFGLSTESDEYEILSR